MTKEEAVQLGEEIRQCVEVTPFLIESDLAEEGQRELVFVTVSIGVSNVPDDTDETKGLYAMPTVPFISEPNRPDAIK